MALVLKDRVKETSTTAGTGTLTLGGAVAGFQSFSVIGDSNQTYYAIVDASAGTWEVGLGTYTSGGTTLSRDTVFESSNAGALVDFASSQKDVFCTYPAERAVSGSQGLVENSATISQSYTINSGRNAMSAGPITVDTGVTVTVSTGARWVVL